MTLDRMPELNKFKTQKTQSNESKISELKFISVNLEGAIAF